MNKGIPYLVCELDAYAQNKALDGALKQIKAVTSTTSAMFISSDKDNNKVLCMAQVSKEALGKGLKANEWCAQVQKVRGDFIIHKYHCKHIEEGQDHEIIIHVLFSTQVINGKGGGKPENAQASGTNVNGVKEAIKIAHTYAASKLGASTEEVLKLPNQSVPESSVKDTTKVEPVTSAQKLSLKEMLKENFVILHCGGRNSPMINLILIAWEYYGSKSKKIHVKESKDNIGRPKLEYESGKLVEGEAGIVTYLLLSGKAKHNMVDQFESTKAQVFQWLFYAINEVRPPIYSWITESKGFQRSKNETLNIMGRVNEYLLTRTYLVGERISCADISMAAVLLPAVQMTDDATKSSYRNLLRWLSTCVNQPEFTKVLGSTKLV